MKRYLYSFLMFFFLVPAMAWAEDGQADLPSSAPPPQSAAVSASEWSQDATFVDQGPDRKQVNDLVNSILGSEGTAPSAPSAK